MEIGSKFLGANDADKSFDRHFFFPPFVFFLGSRKSAQLKKVELSPGVLEKRFYHLKATLDDSFFEDRSEEFLKDLISTIEKLLWRLKNQRTHDTQTSSCFAKVIKEVRFAEKRVGVVIAFLTKAKHSFLGKEQIQQAIFQMVKGAEICEETFYEGKKGEEEIQSFYFEIQKRDRVPFKEEEIKAIEDSFPYDLMDRVTLFSYPMFLPRNEEEVMRNMLHLSREIRFVKDLPQVVIQYRNQIQHHLIFDLIFCKVRSAEDVGLPARFAEESEDILFLLERTKEMGGIRKKAIKDAYLFQVQVKIKNFLRIDLSVDLSRARQAVLERIKKILGPLRDYNGGILSKEKEFLLKARHEILREKNLNDHLLENVFYSIQPYVMRTLIDPSLIAELYILLDQGGGRETGFQIKEKGEGVVAVLRSSDLSSCQKIQGELEGTFTQMYQLGSISYASRENYFLGLILCSSDRYQKEKFIKFFSDSYEKIFGKPPFPIQKFYD